MAGAPPASPASPPGPSPAAFGSSSLHSKLDEKRSQRQNDRLFDRFVDRTFKTTSGHKAIFSPTKGGSNTNWQNHVLIVGLEVTYADGRTESHDVTAGLIQEVSTSRNTPIATIKVSSLNKSLVDLNAEKVKDGDQYYENRKLSFVLNTLLNEVFKDNQYNLPDDKRVSADLLTVKSVDNKLGYWTLGTYPGFDGNSFSPSPNAIPMTAMTTNEDRSIIYVATGGVSASSSLTTASAQANPPELWQYNIDEDQWTYLATTGTSNVHRYAPIQKLFYNPNTQLLYGIIWKDYADVKSDLEDKANKINWHCPDAQIFKWNPNGDDGYLNDGAHGTGIGNVWPGEWDFRMMFPDEPTTYAGPDRDTSTQKTSGDYSVKHTNNETHKVSKARASVGNYTAYRYISLPFGPAGQQGFSNVHEARRATHWMHPQVAGFKDSQRPVNDLFGSTVELVPTTATNGVSAWTGASGGTTPNGWAKHGTPTFSVGGGNLSVATATDSDTVYFTIAAPLDNMTVYKLGIHGTNFKAQIAPSATRVTNSQVWGPYGMHNSHGYSSTHMGSGDYYFSGLSTNAIPGFPNLDDLCVQFTAEDHSSNLVLENVTLSVAHHWDNWHNVNRQAAENIPLTHYSKLVAGTSIKRPTHQFKGEKAGPQSGTGSDRTWSTHAGPHQWFYDMFDDGGSAHRDYVDDNYQGQTDHLNGVIPVLVNGNPVAETEAAVDIRYRNPAPFEITNRDSDFGNDPLTYEGQLNEEIIMEFNAIAQDRRNMAQIGATGSPPLYGPNDLEDGIQPDNSIRLQVGSRNIRPDSGITVANHNGFKDTSWANEGNIVDLGPTMEATSTEPRGIGQESGYNAGLVHFNANDPTMQKSNQGAGYASVVVQGLGERAHRQEFEIHGAVRYTNGQQGSIVFCPEADEGKGVIIFQRFNGTAPHDDKSFRWDPDATSGQEGHWELGWRYYRCTDGAQGGLSGMPANTNTVSAVTPHSYTSIPSYTTAGCNGEAGNIFFAMHDSRTHSPLYTGSNDNVVRNSSYIYRVALGVGAWSTSLTTTKIYDSESDTSIFNGTMDGSSDSGRFADFTGQTAINKFRKITLLHYNKDLSTATDGSNGLFGASFRRDGILAQFGFNSAPYPPCHEVFAWQGISNRLTIVDHDIQNGSAYDAAGFYGFGNTTGKLANDKLVLGTNPGVFYMRLQKTTVAPQNRDLIGIGLKVNYLYSPSAGAFNAGNFFDDKSVALTKKLRGNEGMISNGQLVAGVIDKGTESEREALFSSFDDYRSWYTTSQKSKRKLGFGSSKEFFKIDDKEIDPRFQLLDFTGLTGFDVISKLAQANNMAFGFDVEKFFLIDRTQGSSTHNLDARDGEIIDIKKSMDNDIRNVISIQAFRQQVQDVEWEVTHVGAEEVLADDQIYNGEFTVTPKTHREASVNLICTRQGRLIRDSLDNDTATAVDAITNVGLRLTPLFKWRTHAPTKQVVLMKPMLSTATELFVNTTFANGNAPVSPGEIVIFVNQTSFEQVGRVITAVDTISNKITIEDNVGSIVESGTPLNIVRSHTGSDKTVTGKTSTSSYGTKYSDEGVTVVTDVCNISTNAIDNQKHGVCSGGNYQHYSDKSACETAGHTWSPTTRLTVNNIKPFADCRITPYTPESYKHYQFIVTTYSSSQMQSVPLPNQSDQEFATATTGADDAIVKQTPLAWVKSIDETNGYIYLNGTYSAFEKGDVLNAHYALPPATMILQTQDGAVQPPPYSSVQSDLPEGLGTWSWKCDSESDKFNLKDIINFKFQGIKLVKDGGSIYTIADTASIAKYGQRAWNFPDNRFITHERVEYWAQTFLTEYGDPKYAITATVPFDPTLTFTTPAGNLLRRVVITDEIMFPGIAGFSVSGYLKETSLNVKNLQMTLKFRTEEKY